jgi:ABC-type branched-subunit amino acid transport system ATPase component
MSAVLEAHGYGKRYRRGNWALRGVDLGVPEGSITALVGPNGSGKTTILRLLSGTVAADSGRTELGRSDLTASTAAERVHAGVVRTLQARAYFGELSAREHALVGVNRTRRHGGGFRTLFSTPQFRAENEEAEARAVAALEAVGLEPRAERPASELTGAEQQRLMIGAALATNPAVLLLDEPSAGAAAGDLEHLIGLLRSLRARGIAILLVEHNQALVHAVADEVLELEQGRIVGRAPPRRN